MANIMFNLGAPISLNQMLPDEAGEPVALPHAIPNTQGLYLILNQNNQQENRYMGISVELRTRFAARQGSCFELGFAKSVLNNIYAYLGTASYQNTGAEDWTQLDAYGVADINIILDQHTYDLEHIFIKAAQHAWPQGTITNTLKTGEFINLGNSTINVIISWDGLAADSKTVSVPAGGRLV
jgi:hypothetical protein